MDRPPAPPRLRLLTGMLVLAYATLEMGAYVTSAVRAQDMRPFSAWSTGRADIAGRLGQRGETTATPSPGQTQRTEVLHPYVGFLSELDTGVASADQVGLDNTEFYDPASPLYHPSAERLVVGVTGGSVAVQFGTGPGADALRQLLLEDPGLEAKQLLIVNLAANGFKQPQQLLAVTYALSLGAHFDLVLNIDGFNEVALHAAENAKKSVHPSYPRGWYFRAGNSPDPEILPVLGTVASAERDRLELARAAETSAWRWSPIFQLIWYSRDRALERRISTQKTLLRRARPKRRDPRRTGPPIEFATDTDLYRYLVARWADSSRQMQRLCTSNGTRYLHFLQPNQYVAGSKALSPEELEHAYNEQQPYRSGVLAGYPLLRQVGAELRTEGIDFTDLTPLFESVGETLYVDDCCHMNGRGNEIMAGAIASVILE
ncbi:MAG: hypothetical protein ACI8QZ_004340 [Chlamydiales bacterium]|jgi:hypothetical protein